MKVFVFALLAFAAFGTSTAAPRSDLSNKINTIIKLIVIILPEKLSITDETITIPDNTIETGSIVLNELSLTGLKGLTIKATDDGTDTHIDYTGGISDLAVVVDIAFDLSGLLVASGNVKISVDLQSLDITGSADVNEDVTEVEDFDLLITLGAGDVEISGIGDEDYSQKLSEEITAALPDAFNEVTKNLEEPFGAVVKFILNLILKN